MKKELLVATLALLGASGVAQAQSSLSNQIDALHSVQSRQKADREAAAEAQRAAIAAQQAADAARQQEAMRRADAERARANAAAAAERAKAETAAAAAQKRQEAARNAEIARQRAEADRNQSYEDQQRELALEEKKVRLQVLKAKAARTNDYIDQELHQQAAQTDVIKSKADAARNVSEGEKSLLQDSGKAQVKKASGWFN